MKKIFTLFAAVLVAASLSARVNEITDGNGLSWWTAAAQAQEGDTLVFAADTISWNYDLELPVSFVFLAKEGMSPIVNMPAKFKLSHGIVVKGLNFVGNGTNDVFRFTKGTGYSAEFDGCTFKKFHYGIRIYTDSTQLEKLIVNNCLFDGFDACAITAVKGKTAPGTVKDVAITNSTILNGGASEAAIYIYDNDEDASTEGPAILIDHCTLYNAASGNYAMYLRKVGPQATFSNCIVSNPASASTSPAPYYGYDNYILKNSLCFNCKAVCRTPVDSVNVITADPMFVDADNGDFTLAAGSPAIGAAEDGSNLGDPRWTKKHEPIVEVEPGNGTLSAAIAAAEDGDTFILSTGAYNESASIAVEKMITIIAGEDQKPVINMAGQFELMAGGFAMANVKVDGSTNTGSYFLSVRGNAAMSIWLDGCEICNYPKYFIDINTKYHIDSLIINDCYIHDIARSVVYAYTNENEDGLPGCSYFEMTNTTVANMKGSGSSVASIYIRNNGNDAEGKNAPKILLNQVTMYSVLDPYGIITAEAGAQVTVKNSIFDTSKSGRATFTLATKGAVSNCLFNNTDKGADADFTACVEADPMFVDATKANFQLYANSPAVQAGDKGQALGDPRWGVSPETALMQVAAEKKVNKMMVNGQMVIIRDGVMYNVLGVQF